MFFEDVDLTDIRNPLKYWCAPNEASYDYVAAYDLVDFIRGVFAYCYVSPEDTSLDYNHNVLYQVREDFLDCLENALCSVVDEVPYWQYIKPNIPTDIDRPDGGVWVEPKDGDPDKDGCHIIWNFWGVQSTIDEEKVDVLRFDFVWSGIVDDFVYWLASDALPEEDITLNIINEARAINLKVKEVADKK